MLDMKNKARITADGTFRAEAGRKSKLTKMFTAMEKGEVENDRDSDGKYSANPHGML